MVSVTRGTVKSLGLVLAFLGLSMGLASVGWFGAKMLYMYAASTEARMVVL